MKRKIVVSKQSKKNPFLESPVSKVQSLMSVFCPVSNVQCLMSDFPDYMHFRYYASTMGRFLKPDNIIPNPANPQSWNLYSYVQGNPVNFNDPSGHYGNVPLGMKQSRLAPPGGSIWDMAMGMFYDESIDGFSVSYSDWAVTGGDSNVSGQGEEQVDPLASIPDASTLPEDQRNAYVLYGTGTPQEMEEKVIPFPAAAAGEAADYLINKGYSVETIQVTSNDQLKTIANSGLFAKSIVVIAAHYFPNFYWNQALSTSGSTVAKWLGRSGASQVIYMSCKSSHVAAKTAIVGSMPTWGASGYLHPHFVYPPTYYQSGNTVFTGYFIDYWYITK